MSPLEPCFQTADGCRYHPKMTIISESNVGNMLANSTPKTILSYKNKVWCRRSDSASGCTGGPANGNLTKEPE